MRINKNLDLNSSYKCYRKVCACNISLKRINDIVKGQNVILLNNVAKISVYIYTHTQGIQMNPLTWPKIKLYM